MVDFVLDYLGCPAGEAIALLFEVFVQIGDCDIFVSNAGADAGKG